MNVLIIGSHSAIANATARLYAQQHCQMFLLARNQERLQEQATALKLDGAESVQTHCLDLLDHDGHQAAVDAAKAAMGSIDVALICHGSLPDQEAMELDFKAAREALDVNGLTVISLLTCLVPLLKHQGRGTLAVVTSVAGDRGRQPNFVYGAAKAMVSTYLQGLRGKLLPFGVHVLDIRPGLVDSPMTARFKKGLLWSTPERVAKKIVRSIEKKRHTVYAPGYWRLIMALVRSIPEFIFKRLKF